MAVNKHKVLLTKEGYRKLQKELEKREGKVRTKLQETLNQMRKQGDLRENDGYSLAVEDFQNNEEKILEIRKTLETSEIVTEKKTNVVDIGSKVTIECQGGQLKTFDIVGINEANPLELKISYKSPIGSSLMGKKKGAKLSIETPAGETACTILTIE
ncbi:transcription elongation factor GreA [Candidatus Dojkabacteria bacterium HGW-Dojkabacteria-1]|uniref:Transcription elongation factor GreA n=1 Tax=Candidatus Dojkabacteria bacterium HGW-Dojkabacteria-1 TaxID=2013761 RepID=A0A2N2F336_9BACT|nr:MAG: transcription elongation factor GreA [Candidatus Dojkabacteria bacterium HGW-Dojkabacteria-1]